jgi:hypothetical protein
MLRNVPIIICMPYSTLQPLKNISTQNSSLHLPLKTYYFINFSSNFDSLKETYLILFLLISVSEEFIVSSLIDRIGYRA